MLPGVTNPPPHPPKKKTFYNETETLAVQQHRADMAFPTLKEARSLYPNVTDGFLFAGHDQKLRSGGGG